MAIIIFGLSFQQEGSDLPAHRHDMIGASGSGVSVPQMTSIFNVAFRATFSDIRTFPVPTSITTAPLGDVRLLACQVFRTAPAALRRRGSSDYLLIVVLELRADAADVPRLWATANTPDAKIALLRSVGLGPVVDRYAPSSGAIVGQNSIVVADEPGFDAAIAGSIFAFYFFAWISCLRIERAQLATDLNGDARRAMSASSWDIANQRLAILNVRRYSLTLDRSNSPVFKRLCAALSEKFKIQSRYERLIGIHRDFEHHLDNVSKIIQSQQLGSVSSLLLILTLLSVPISLFGALIALNLKSEVFTSPVSLMFDYRVYILFAAGFLVALAPFILLKLYDRWRDVRVRDDG